MSINMEAEKVTIDLVPPPPPATEHLCYVRCNFCNTVLAVVIPWKRMMETVTVKCGHCSNLSFLCPRPPPQTTATFPSSATLSCPDHHPRHHSTLQGFNFMEKQENNKKGQASSSASSSELLSPLPPFVVKPPEKKHRLPSAYNRFMKEEIQRIKAANPEIPHREAFSAAAKNWARYLPNSPAGSLAN